MYWKRKQNAIYILVYQQQFRLRVTAWRQRRTNLGNMQNFGVNLICVEDGIDSSKDAGKLMISVLSAVAEIEHENIRAQTIKRGKYGGIFAHKDIAFEFASAISPVFKLYLIKEFQRLKEAVLLYTRVLSRNSAIFT